VSAASLAAGRILVFSPRMTPPRARMHRDTDERCRFMSENYPSLDSCFRLAVKSQPNGFHVRGVRRGSGRPPGAVDRVDSIRRVLPGLRQYCGARRTDVTIGDCPGQPRPALAHHALHPLGTAPVAPPASVRIPPQTIRRCRYSCPAVPRPTRFTTGAPATLTVPLELTGERAKCRKAAFTRSRQAG
jgi:hypothetical protein